MKEKIQQLLANDFSNEKELVLNILYLKYKMVNDMKENSKTIEFKSYLCINNNGNCYSNEIANLEKYYSIDIEGSNPFKHEVIKSLEDDCLIEISKSPNNKGSIRLKIPNGIEYLREIYKTEEELENTNLTNMVIYKTVNIVNIHIDNIITNITQNMSKVDKEDFITILNEYSKDKDKETLIKKLVKFSTRVGEDIFTKFVADLLNPNNLSQILGNINF